MRQEPGTWNLAPARSLSPRTGCQLPTSPTPGSLVHPHTVTAASSAPDRGLGNSERKPFKSAFLENAKPAKLGQTLHWVSLRGDSNLKESRKL